MDNVDRLNHLEYTGTSSQFWTHISLQGCAVLLHCHFKLPLIFPFPYIGAAYFVSFTVLGTLRDPQLLIHPEKNR